jgi:AbiV family abortive infection protein
MKKLDDKNKIIKNCLDNAETLISSAEELNEKSERENIAYTLATLSLEEVGKASLLKSAFAIKEMNVDFDKERDLGLDDHVKKLFWAFWGPTFGKEKITKESIEQYKGLANSTHNKRLIYLYTDTTQTRKTKVSKAELKTMLGLARARLMIEKSHGLLEIPDKKHAKQLKWFLESTQDQSKRIQIFSGASMKKFAELKDSNKWIRWLYDEFQKTDEKSKKLLKKELRRKRPKGRSAMKPKWEVEVRLTSQSHSLRNKCLAEWNKNVEHPKLFMGRKNELIVKFTLPASVHVTKLWELSLDTLNLFLIALNVGATGGIIFRNIPRDAAKFHNKIIDLDSKSEIVVELNPKLNIDWKKARWVLDEKTLIRIQKVMLLFYTEGRKSLKLDKNLIKYLQGIAMFSKTDVLLRLETDAFQMFMDCLIGLIREDNTSITVENLKEEILNILNLEKNDELNRYMNAWSQLKNGRRTTEEITLTDVIGAKMYCDIYILEKAQENVITLSKKDNT